MKNKFLTHFLILIFAAALPSCQSRSSSKEAAENKAPDPLYTQFLELKNLDSTSAAWSKNPLLKLAQTPQISYALLQSALEKWPLFANAPKITPSVAGVFWAPHLGLAPAPEKVSVWQDLVLAETLGVLSAELNSLKSYQPGACITQYQSFFNHQDYLKGQMKNIVPKIRLANIEAFYFLKEIKDSPKKESRSFTSTNHLQNALGILCYELALVHSSQLKDEGKRQIPLFLKGQNIALPRLNELASRLAQTYVKED